MDRLLRSPIALLLLILLVPFSCGRDPMPAVPPFEELGFADSLHVVRSQILAAYKEWEEMPRNAERNGRLGMLLFAYNKYHSSGILFRRAYFLEPGEFRWSYYLAITLSRLGRLEEAIETYRAALRSDPGHVEARIRLAGLLLKTNRIDDSVMLYKEITVDSPARVEGWLGLGKALSRKGNLAAATAALRRARIIGPQYGEVHYALATVLAASGEDAEAARELAAYERTRRNEIQLTGRLDQQLVALHAGDQPHMSTADYHMGGGRFDDAVASYRSALMINPMNQNAWGGLIDALARLDDQAGADSAYQSALAAGISYTRLHFTYGMALLKWQRIDAARDALTKAIELDPRYSDALFAIGELEMQSGNTFAAVEQFRSALSARPNDRQIVLALARSLNAERDYAGAAARLKALQSDPAVDSALVLKELAIAYYGLNRKEKAHDALTRSRAAASKSANSLVLDEIDSLLAEWRAE